MRKRKPYRRRIVGTPILAEMHRELVLPAYSALTTLQLSADTGAMESAWHTLGGFLDMIYVALCRRDLPTAEVEAGMLALHAIHARHKATGSWRPSGPELQALRAAVVIADERIPHLRTDEIRDAVLQVDRIVKETT